MLPYEKEGVVEWGRGGREGEKERGRQEEERKEKESQKLVLKKLAVSSVTTGCDLMEEDEVEVEGRRESIYGFLCVYPVWS